MSKKMKAFKKQLRDRSRDDQWDLVSKEFGFSNTGDNSEKPAYRKPSSKKKFNNYNSSSDGGNNTNYQKKVYNKKDESTPVIFDIKTPDELSSIFELELLTTGKGIPVTTEFATDTGCRFVIYTSGDFKKPVWTPKEKTDNGVQALIPVAPKNLIVDYDKESDTICIYKITEIKDSKNNTKVAKLFVYNIYENGKWSKKLFESLNNIKDYCVNKIEDRDFVCHTKVEYQKKTDDKNDTETTSEETVE